MLIDQSGFPTHCSQRVRLDRTLNAILRLKVFNAINQLSVKN